MKGKVSWVLVVVLALGCAFLAYRSCGTDAKLQAALDEAARWRGLDEADKADRDRIEAEKNAVIAEQDKKIADLLAHAGEPTPAEVEKDKAIAELKKRVADYEAQGDLPAALASAKETIVQLEAKFTLSEQTHRVNILNLNAAWQTKFDALQAIADARLSSINVKDERIVSLEKALGIATHGRKASKFITKAALVVAGAGIIYGIAK